MTKRIENLNRKNFRHDSCWYLHADKVVCPVKLFGSFSITFECISFSLFSGCLRRNAKISKGTRSTNSRTPDLKSSDSPWQSYKKAPPRVEGSFRWNEPLKIWKFPGFVRKSLLFLWPCATFSLTLKRTVYIVVHAKKKEEENIWNSKLSLSETFWKFLVFWISVEFFLLGSIQLHFQPQWNTRGKRIGSHSFIGRHPLYTSFLFSHLYNVLDAHEVLVA